MNTATFNDRLQLLFWACFSLLLGLGFIFYGFVVFGYLVAALPWILSVAGGLIFLSGILRKSRRGYFKIVPGAVIFCCGLGRISAAAAARQGVTDWVPEIFCG